MSFNTAEDIRKYYESSAEDAYKRWGGKTKAVHFGYFENGGEDHFASLSEMNERFLDFSKIEDGDIILDSGCGYGSEAIAIATKFKNSYVVATNISPKQIRDADLNLREANLEDRVFVLNEDYALMEGIEGGVFDKALMCESIFHAQEKSRVLKAHHRVLKDGGRLSIADYFIKRELSSEEAKLVRIFNAGWVGRIGDLSNFSASMEDIFSDVEVLDISSKVMPSMKLASDSASSHDGDETVSPERKLHRQATIVLYKLMESGAAGYYFIAGTK